MREAVRTTSSVGDKAVVPHPGTAFLLAATVLFAAGVIGWAVARRAQRAEAAA